MKKYTCQPIAVFMLAMSTAFSVNALDYTELYQGIAAPETLTSLVINEKAGFICFSTTADAHHTVVRWSKNKNHPARVFNLEEMSGLGKNKYRYSMDCQYASNLLVDASRYTGNPICLSSPTYRSQVFPNEVRSELGRIQEQIFGADP